MPLHIPDPYPQDIPNRILAMATRRRTMEELNLYAEKNPAIRNRIDDILSMNRERIDSALICLLDTLRDAERIDESVRATLHAEWIAELAHMSVGAEDGSR